MFKEDHVARDGFLGSMGMLWEDEMRLVEEWRG